jgi:hypothetical protein
LCARLESPWPGVRAAALEAIRLVVPRWRPPPRPAEHAEPAGHGARAAKGARFDARRFCARQRGQAHAGRNREPPAASPPPRPRCRAQRPRHRRPGPPCPPPPLPPPSRTNWTRLVPPSVLTGRVPPRHRRPGPPCPPAPRRAKPRRAPLAAARRAVRARDVSSAVTPKIFYFTSWSIHPASWPIRVANVKWLRVLARPACNGHTTRRCLRHPLLPLTPPSRTKWTRRVPHPVLIGHAASLTPY